MKTENAAQAGREERRIKLSNVRGNMVRQGEKGETKKRGNPRGEVEKGRVCTFPGQRTRKEEGGDTKIRGGKKVDPKEPFHRPSVAPRGLR